MDGKWMTYTEAAVRLGVSLEAARRRAIRGKWPRMPGNDGRTRVQVPDELHHPRTPDVRIQESEVVHALEAHIATLKTELASEKERSDREVAELKGEVELLKGQLVTERERGDRAQGELVVARAAADRATAELVELARRLAAIAEAKPDKSVEAEPELPRRRLGRAWGWFLRN
jgi:hypothetical protein